MGRAKGVIGLRKENAMSDEMTHSDRIDSLESKMQDALELMEKMTEQIKSTRVHVLTILEALRNG
jgi:hypothetical protein